MARLPSDKYLIQQIGDEIVLHEDGTEEELVRWHVGDQRATTMSQQAISASERLSPEDKAWAHFWSGYFFGHHRASWSPE